MAGDDSCAGGPTTTPVDTLPIPAVGYAVRDGDPLVAATNDAFDAAFDADPTGRSLAQWLRPAEGSEGVDGDELTAALADGEAVDAIVELDSKFADSAGSDAYRLRTWDEGSSDETVDAYVLLTESGVESTDGVAADRIASVVSHDLRNPLDVANAHLRAARETGSEEHFDAVRRSHDRMERIIRDVLTLARGENALAVDTDVDTERVAMKAWATVETGDADLSVASDLPTIDADPDRLQRLFENVFRNSVEHARPTDERTGVSEGDVTGESDQSLRVRVGGTDGGFFVADDGVGIPDSERERVFDPGYSSDRNGDGTGLGLTIVERIAAAHDWGVSVATSAGDGARFEFESGADGD
ncbi:sensor histidine kinase [Halorubellus salinus]|uniref:sensor histidine kinase n=1 Tax=Halorubellus salinus TaxID=755309 RepID=UPI001D06C877|nr:HAMP domain-containing sensor histidine kinase [Halorubellus salinus]